jgi:hypothetical protein
VFDQSNARWHWDRKIPIALIVTIVLVFVGQTWTAGMVGLETDARIETLERQATTSAPLAATQDNRLTRVETKLEAVQDGIAEINRSSAKSRYRLSQDELS